MFFDLWGRKGRVPGGKNSLNRPKMGTFSALRQPESNWGDVPFSGAIQPWGGVTFGFINPGPSLDIAHYLLLFEKTISEPRENCYNT